MNRKLLADYLDSLEKDGIPGCDCILYLEHKLVFRHIAGFADAGKTKPLSNKTTYWLFSASKLFTCTAAMQLAEKGALSLDAPVSDYLPEYGAMKVKSNSGIAPAKHAMTVRHLLSMQSGLNYRLDAPSILKVLAETGGHADTRRIIRALAGEPLDFEPGTHFQYSLSHDVLGAVIEAASGRKLGTYMRENIFRPLGMKNTGFRLTPGRKANMSDQFVYDTPTMTSAPTSLTNCYALSDRYESGGAGLISTADDYILFLDAMCNEGISRSGYRVLTAESIESMRKDQLNDVSRKDFESFNRPGYSYGLGVRTLIEKKNSGARSPLGEFGWDGAAGAYALIDTKNRLALFYVQHVRNCGYVYNVIHPRIRDLAYEMLEINN